MRKRRYLPFRFKIIIFTSLVVLSCLITLSFSLIFEFYPKLTQQYTNVVDSTLVQYETFLDQFFCEYENDLRYFEQIPELTGVITNEEVYLAPLQNRFADFQKTHNSIRLISFGTEEGKYYFDPMSNHVPEGYDPRVRPWYILSESLAPKKIAYTLFGAWAIRGSYTNLFIVYLFKICWLPYCC